MAECTSHNIEEEEEKMHFFVVSGDLLPFSILSVCQSLPTEGVVNHGSIVRECVLKDFLEL